MSDCGASSVQFCVHLLVFLGGRWTGGQGAKLNVAHLGKVRNSVPNVTRMLSMVSLVSSYSLISLTCGRLMTLRPSRWSLWSLMTSGIYRDLRPNAALVALDRRSLRGRFTGTPDSGRTPK